MPQVNQMSLITAIARELDRQGVGQTTNIRQFDAIIEATDLVVREYTQENMTAEAAVATLAGASEFAPTILPNAHSLAAPPLLRNILMHRRLKAWLSSDETGLSSMAMASKLVSLVMPDERVYAKRPTAQPEDGSDFGRCVGLLDAVPELREHMSRMAEVSRVWGRLVGNWDELENMYRESKAKGNGGTSSLLYRRIRELIEQGYKDEAK